MMTAFVLSGGGNLGAVQVGMLLALFEHGVAPDILVGTSVGALNAAYLAADTSLPGVQRLAAMWEGISRRDVFPTSPIRAMLALSGRGEALVDPAALRRVLERALPYGDLSAPSTPIAVIATEVTTGAEVVLRRGSVVDAVMASAAIPGVFPPVELEGHVLMDGGIVNHTPIATAVEMGADEVYVLPTGHACALAAPPHSALGMALHAVATAIQQRLVRDVAAMQDTVALKVAPPLCPVSVAPTDFTQTAQLIERSRAATSGWLERPLPADQSIQLRLHSHH
jgi:NTE family protein